MRAVQKGVHQQSFRLSAETQKQKQQQQRKEKAPQLTPEESAAKLQSLISETKGYEEDALKCIAEATDAKEVEVLRVAFLGKNGKIMDMMKEMRVLGGKEKPMLGEVVNAAKTRVESAITEAAADAIVAEIKKRIQKESLGMTGQIPSIPAFHYGRGHRHPLSLTLELTTQIFEEIGYEAICAPEDSPEIENDFFNFAALGMPDDHPARDMQDTFYINTDGIETTDTLLLRTHTSAVQIREMEKRTPPFKIVVPGRVYRKDDVDATHYPVFHQCEILAVDEIGKLTLPHLLGTVKYFLQKMFGPEIDVKYRASYFPFTEPSIEVDVFFKGRWLEVLGCGMVDPVVLESVGLDPKKYGGFAAGFGIERFAMIMYGIKDLRLFWENNLSFLEQFPSRPLAIAGDDDEERLRDEETVGFDEYEGEVE
jgi:phenylalanyl-tRNA synthetase alpha chain